MPEPMPDTDPPGARSGRGTPPVLGDQIQHRESPRKPVRHGRPSFKGSRVPCRLQWRTKGIDKNSPALGREHDADGLDDEFEVGPDTALFDVETI